MRRKIVSLILLIFLFIGLSLACASTQEMAYRANLSSPKELNLKESMDVIYYVLYENGFEIKSMNESFGIIETEWKKVEYSNVGMTFLAAATLGDAATYDRFIKMSFKVSGDGYSVTPREKQGSHVTSRWGSQSNNESEIQIDFKSKEGQLIEKIVDEINKKLNISSTIEWDPFEKIN